MEINLKLLFLDWLKEWHREAVGKNAKSKFTLKKAIGSLTAFEAGLACPKDAAKLDGIGSGLVAKFSERLALLYPKDAYDASSLLLSPISPLRKKVKKTAKEFIPNYRSGSYAIILALSLAAIPLCKAEIVATAQKFCDTSFLVPERLNYTAWNSIETLLKKELVLKYGTSKANSKYELSDEGRLLALKLQPLKSEESFLDIESLTISQKNATEKQSSAVCTLQNYEIVLLVDSRERNDARERSSLLEELQNLGVAAQACTLQVGDFLWIAKGIDSDLGKLVVLDVVVERKRHDDFISSIVGDRFREQKQRLAHCCVPKVVYLLEAHRNKNLFEEFGSARITSALAELQIVNNFLVKHTGSMHETVSYLASMHTFMKESFSAPIAYHNDLNENALSTVPKELRIRFEYFQDISSKSGNLTVSDIFMRQLLSIKGFTFDIVQAVAEKYPTPATLCLAYQQCQTTKQQEDLLSSLVYGKAKKIGPKRSQLAFKLFN